MEFLARFDFDITYVKGETNLVADALSRYYENDQWDESHEAFQYVIEKPAMMEKVNDIEHRGSIGELHGGQGVWVGVNKSNNPRPSGGGNRNKEGQIL